MRETTTIRPANVLLLAALAFALPAIGGLLILSDNVFVFQRASGNYPAKLEGLFVDGLGGILFSPGRGLLVCTPVVLFALCNGLGAG